MNATAMALSNLTLGLTAHGRAAAMLPYWIGATALFAVYAWMTTRQSRVQALELGHERRIREELEAYSALDMTLPHPADQGADHVSAVKALAVRVCRAVAGKSAFTRVMVLTRSPHGPLKCAGSIGVDDLTVAAVERWGEQVVREEHTALPDGSQPVGSCSSGTRRLDRRAGIPQITPPALQAGATKFTIELGKWREFDAEISSWKMSGRSERRQSRRAIVLPVRGAHRTGTPAGAPLASAPLTGAIVVCLDGLSAPPHEGSVEALTSPLEMLAARLGRAVELVR